MKIILIRHGKTRGNYLKRYIGETDEELFDTRCLERVYPDCVRVVSSPMKRCAQTAEFIYPDKKIRVCNDLHECSFGDFENKSFEDLKDNEKYKEWLESGGTLPFPNGESRDDFIKRSVSGFFEMLTEEDTAFVIHGGSIMAVMQTLFGGDFYDYMVENGGGYVFEYDCKTGKASDAVRIERGENT